MKCRVTNGFAEIGDIITLISYGNENRYLYRVTEFGEYNGVPQIRYRKVIPETLEFFPDTIDSWMDFDEARSEIKIVQKGKVQKSLVKTILKRILHTG